MSKELHENEEGTGEKPRCMENARAEREGERKGKGIRIKSLQGKGAETAVKWKEVKGHARKLSGKTCKGSEVQIIPTTHRTWRERK